jgi:uncharacterized membrane protein required for colicin V production
MLLDLVLVVIMIVAIIKGYQRGLIVGVFSLVGIIIGLAAAIKLSAVVAGYIGKAITISHTWLAHNFFYRCVYHCCIACQAGSQYASKNSGSCFAWLGQSSRGHTSLYRYLSYYL